MTVVLSLGRIRRAVDILGAQFSFPGSHHSPSIVGREKKRRQVCFSIAGTNRRLAALPAHESAITSRDKNDHRRLEAGLPTIRNSASIPSK
jgi:hypothetical protein